jgi:transcriptional regulator with XRE-family HTH domain
MDNKLVGQNIRKYRRFRDMSQKELAKAVGYATKSSINKIEAGEASVPIPRLTQIANALRVPLQALMENIPDDGMPYEDYSTSEATNISQADELDFIVQGNIELEKVHELLNDSEKLYKSYQSLYKNLEDIAKQVQDESLEQQENRDLVSKYRQITAEHQQTIMTILNGFYQIDSQAQKNTAQTDGEESNKKTATAK